MRLYAEKRVDNRAELCTQAKYKVLSAADGNASFGYENAQMKNISRSGVCMSIEHKLPEGSVIRVDIPTLEDSIKSIKAFCEVQWCSKPQDNSNYEVGLSFIALKEEDLDYLNNLVGKDKRVM